MQDSVTVDRRPQRGPGDPLIEIDDVSFAYGDQLVLKRISFTIRQGEFVAIIGPSGCGKSTLLTMLTGMLQPGAGEIRIAGQPVKGPGDDRAVVFQSFALLPWKSVEENVALGLRYRRRDLARSERRVIARRYISMVGLGGFEDRFPHQLSGGMQQRVGLARAFAVDAPILLMDEPFAAVDAQNAELLREELRDIVAREARTIVFITHNLDEALFLSDRILLMGTRPGVIAEDVRIDLPQPRGLDVVHDAERARYAGYRARLWEHLRAAVEAEKALQPGEPG